MDNAVVVLLSQGCLETVAIWRLDFLLSEVKEKGKAQTEGARQRTFCGNQQLLSHSKAQHIQK